MKVRLWILAGLCIFVGCLAFVSSKMGHDTGVWIKNVGTMVQDKAHFRVRQITILWQPEIHYTTREDIEKAISVIQGMPMTDVDLGVIRERVEQLPWVRSCIVERYLPGELSIHIQEKIPIAIWQNNKKYHPLDELAEPIQTDKKMPSDLLLVVGEKAPEHLLSLLGALEQVPEIYQYVRSAIWVGDRRWNLKLFNAEAGLEVLLPEGEEMIAALKRLDVADKKEKLIKRKIKAIDIRQKDKIILRPLDETKKTIKGKKK